MTGKGSAISRRDFTKISALGAAVLASGAGLGSGPARAAGPALTLGGPVSGIFSDPQDWIEALQVQGYRAAYCPLEPEAPADQVRAFAAAAEKAGIVIAEVGAWSNPLSRDDNTRHEALAKCRAGLALAESIGARCCVNISGSRGEVWDGPDPDNLTEATFDLIVETTRSIIDEVQPTRSFFTLETMPWAYPDSPDSYLRLIKATDRKQFAAHLDPVNLVSSPQRYFNNGDLIRECFAKLGSYIKSCHAKDILLQLKLTTHLDEVRPGTGGLDYTVYLKELSSWPGTPLMLEHLDSEGDYRLAAEFIRATAGKLGLSINYK